MSHPLRFTPHHTEDDGRVVGDMRGILCDLHRINDAGWDCTIAQNVSHEDAVPIVRAVNSYDAMLAALKEVRALVCEGAETGFNPLSGSWAERLYANNAKLSRAIRLAEGKEEAS